jgi:NAD(P)-dependent dehydrogenase (short-subunit alcohol dehydrogenase family)
MFVKTDVSSYESVEGCVKATVAKFGKLDVLINCAGQFPSDAMHCHALSTP